MARDSAYFTFWAARAVMKVSYFLRMFFFQYFKGKTNFGSIRLNFRFSNLSETLKPSLSMKILSINNFTIKLLSKLLSDLSIGVHLKSSFDTKNFGSKVSNRQYFNMKNSLSMKKLSINNFTNKLLSTF